MFDESNSSHDVEGHILVEKMKWIVPKLFPTRLFAIGNEPPSKDPIGSRVRVAVSVDWEGAHLLQENLHAFQDLRKAHPDVPLTHFMNAAYYTKSENDCVREWDPHEVLSSIDEIGLHVHGWKSLVESSGVDYRSESENFGFEQRQTCGDVGWDTDIRAYTVDELQAIIAKSKAILEEQGLKVGTSFRAGAWLAGPNVLEAVRRQGFLVDASAVDPDKWLGIFAGEPLFAMVREVWPLITHESQPFFIETPVGKILEMPDTGALTDYTTVRKTIDHVSNAVHQLDSEDLFVHMGFHQESAAAHLRQVKMTINKIKRKYGRRVVFETLESSAQRACDVIVRAISCVRCHSAAQRACDAIGR